MSHHEFTGFPEAGLRFLEDLGANNEKVWFEANKDVYKRELLEPAVQFVTALGERLQALNPNIRYDTRTNGSGSLMRIYRDVRFSKDKSPYKTSVAGMWWEGEGKKTASSAYGFHLEASGMGLMAGQFGFSKEQLQAYREAVDYDRTGKALVAVIAAVQQAGDYTIVGEHYKRVPRGYDPDHPRAALLRYNSLYAHPPMVSRAQVLTAELVDVCLAHFENMAPIQRWLADVRQA